MRIKTAFCLCLQPVRLSCNTTLLRCNQCGTDHNDAMSVKLRKLQRFNDAQRGASTLVLALFVVVVVVTSIVGILLGHKIGYQRGYYSTQSETERATLNSQQATKELEALRLSSKISANEAVTAKQELAISLANLDELRQNQQQLSIKNQQITQLNNLYADVLGKKGGMSLRILGAKIKPLPENAFEYGFDVATLGTNATAKSVDVMLVLLDEDNFVEVPIEPSRYSIKGIERIRGRFVMPSGFKPKQIKFTLKSGGQEVEQLYDWQLGDMVDNMPLSLMDVPEVDESPIEPEA